jgi:hypothetical protein
MNIVTITVVVNFCIHLTTLLYYATLLRYSPLLSATLRYSPLLSATLHYSPLLSASLRYSPLLSATLRYSPLLSATLCYSLLLSATLRYSLLLSTTLRYSPLLLSEHTCSNYSSAIITGCSAWTLYEYRNYHGRCQCLHPSDEENCYPGFYKDLGKLSNQISSVRHGCLCSKKTMPDNLDVKSKSANGQITVTIEQ